MPEETDTIVLYNGNWTLSFTIEAAVRLFEEQYPDVNVVVQNYGDEIDTIIRTEIPAGKGPDLLYANVDDLPDVYKAMETGLFEDLGPYEEKDADFTLDDYISGIMDASLFCGKQYILPVQHSSLVLTTTEEALRDAGVAVSELALFPSFASAAIRFRAEHPEGHLFAWDDDIYEQKHLSLFRD